MTFKWPLCLLVLLVLCSDDAMAQVLGPELEAKTLEIGYIGMWFHRKVEPEFPSGTDWGGESFFIKYGISKWLTLSTEGFIWSRKWRRFPDRDYRSFRIGAGITSRVMETDHFRMALALHYSESLWFDRSRSKYHKAHRSFVSTIQIQRTLHLYRQSVTFWAAPAYVFDEITQYPFGSPWPYRSRSFNNIGFAVGSNCLLFNHVEPFFHIVYADFFQPRFGIGYTF